MWVTCRTVVRFDTFEFFSEGPRRVAAFSWYSRVWNCTASCTLLGLHRRPTTTPVLLGCVSSPCTFRRRLHTKGHWNSIIWQPQATVLGPITPVVVVVAALSFSAIVYQVKARSNIVHDNGNRQQRASTRSPSGRSIQRPCSDSRKKRCASIQPTNPPAPKIVATTTSDVHTC